MKKFDKIMRILEAHRDELATRFQVKELGVFGSVVRGEAGRGSDIDILVEFSRPVGLFHFLGLEAHLQRLLGARVDLVSKKALKPRIGSRILDEAVFI